MYVGEKYWQEEVDHLTHVWIIQRSKQSKIKHKTKLVYAAAIGVKMESAGRDCNIGRRRRRQNKTNHIYQHHHYLRMTLAVTIESPKGYTTYIVTSYHKYTTKITSIMCKYAQNLQPQQHIMCDDR
jgi:hypothetical protein